MKVIVFITCFIVSTLAQAADSLTLEHLMLVVPEGVQSPSMPNFHVYRSEDRFLNENLLSFEELLRAQNSSELVIKNYVVIPRFHLDRGHLPHSELMFMDKGELFVKHIIDNGARVASSKIATVQMQKTIAFSAPNPEGKYVNYRIYGLKFEEGVKITLQPEHRITPGSEFVLDIEKRLEVEAQNRKLEQLKNSVLANIGKKISRAEMRRLKKINPGLRSSIKDMLGMIKAQLLESNYSRKQAKRLLSELEFYLYGMAKNVPGLHYKNTHSISNDSVMLLKPAHIERYNQDHIDDRVIDLMKLFFDTVDAIDEARKLNQQSKIEQLSIDAIRLISEVYLTAGRTLGSIGQQKAYSGMISMIGSVGFFAATYFAQTQELKMASSSLAIAFFLHSLAELYGRQYTYKNSILTYPFIKRLVEKNNARHIRKDRVHLAYEIAVRGNQKYMYKNSAWYEYALENNIVSNEFIDKVFGIIEKASGKDISKAIQAMNIQLSCKRLF